MFGVYNGYRMLDVYGVIGLRFKSSIKFKISYGRYCLGRELMRGYPGVNMGYIRRIFGITSV